MEWNSTLKPMLMLTFRISANSTLKSMLILTSRLSEKHWNRCWC
jgi:hypothetical protein